MPTSTGLGDALTGIGLTPPPQTQPKSNNLGQADFLKLLTTQLQYQDPLKPMDNQQFIAQMTQFSQLDSLQKLQGSFDSLSLSLTSNQALQASTMVGRAVLVPGEVAVLGGEGTIAAGQVKMPSDSYLVKVEVRDPNGALVRTIQYPLADAPPGSKIDKGDFTFAWDGKNDAGVAMTPGPYSFKVSAQIGNQQIQLPTNIWARVGSVSLQGADGSPQLNLLGLGPISLRSVLQISG